MHFLDYFARHGFAADYVEDVANAPDRPFHGWAYWKLMQDESYLAFLDMVALDLPDPAKVGAPLLILGVARDNMLKPSEIEATARAYHTQSEIIPDVAHNSMLEPRWQTVADRIKIAASLVAVGSNLICTAWVFQRRRIEDVNGLLGFRRRIWSLAAVGVIFATPALYLGLVYFRE